MFLIYSRWSFLDLCRFTIYICSVNSSSLFFENYERCCLLLPIICLKSTLSFFFYCFGDLYGSLTLACFLTTGTWADWVLAISLGFGTLGRTCILFLMPTGAYAVRLVLIYVEKSFYCFYYLAALLYALVSFLVLWYCWFYEFSHLLGGL